MQLERLSALELGSLVNSKQLSPREVIQYFADRISQRNTVINAFVQLHIEVAMDKAASLERRLARGENGGCFAGVPFGLKDFLPSKIGWYNTHGGVKSLKQVDDYNSRFCIVMENEGGIAIGKTNAPAFGFRGTTDNKLYGPTRNPFREQYNAGGSSGGSAAAVASGMCPISEGGDAGGSIRIPAAWCNLVGFKASSGLIPNVCRPDAYTATHPFCTPGGLAKTVLEARTLFSLMKKYDKRDPYSVVLTSSVTKKSKPKIALITHFGRAGLEKKMDIVVKKAAEKFIDLGCTLDLVNFPSLRDSYEYAEMWCQALIIDSAIDLLRWKECGFDLITGFSNELSPELIYWLQRGLSANIRTYSQWNILKTELYDAFTKVFEDYDYILSPVTACFPVKNGSDYNTLGPSEINGVKTEPLIGFSETYPTNILGLPAISLPAGMHDGLPVGIQLIGKRLSDYELLDLAAKYEEYAPWSQYYEKSMA